MSSRHLRTSVTLGLIAIAIAAQAAVPRGAFIRRPVKSVPDLVAHVKTDPVVMARFTRHFRLTPTQLQNYFSSLHIAKLANDGVYLVYNVHEDNVIRGRYFKLKKGTLVFADNTGRPILKKECGNAMTMSLPSIVAQAPTTKSVGAKVVQGDTQASNELVMMAPGVTPPPITPPVASPVRSQVAGGFVGGGGGFAILPLILGLGSSSFLLKKEDCDCPPVPEPATLAILATGASTLILKRRKRS